MERLVSMILFVGGGWLLPSNPSAIGKQKTKDFEKEGGGNGPHN